MRKGFFWFRRNKKATIIRISPVLAFVYIHDSFLCYCKRCYCPKKYTVKPRILAHGLIQFKEPFWWVYIRGNNKINNFSLAISNFFVVWFFFRVWEHSCNDRSCNGFNKKNIERLQYSNFFVEAIALLGYISFRKLFVKNGFRETSEGYFIN